MSDERWTMSAWVPNCPDSTPSKRTGNAGMRNSAVKLSPLLGEHTTQVFGDWLGTSAGDVKGLRDDRIVRHSSRQLLSRY